MNSVIDADPLPVVIILHGDDRLGIRREIDHIIKKTAENDPFIEMNITRLDGRLASDKDLDEVVSSLPFLSSRRLVIVTNPLAKTNTDAARKRYQLLLQDLPDSTCLVMVFEDTFERNRWKSLHENHWLLRWQKEAGSRAKKIECKLPEIGRMPDWILKEAARQGGQFSREAAVTLMGLVANDTQLAAIEITKLLTYVDYKRTVSGDDVLRLTAQAGQGDVFKMVDEMSSGNASAALNMLHQLLEEQEPIQIFGMIVRQFRLLMQVRELLDERRSHDISAELGLHPVVANKLSQQARRYEMAQIERIYHVLLEMDEAMKTGLMPPDLVLDTFIAEIAR